MALNLRFKPTHRELKSILLYLIDWISVGGTALVAYSFSKLTPYIRPFSIQDQTIAYPHQDHAKIPTRLLATFSTIIPGVLIAALVFLLPSYRTKSLKQKLWMLNTGWLGLGVSIAAAMLVTDGMKNLVGKPRPDFLSRCDADPEKIASGDFDIGESGFLYSALICRSWEGTTRTGLDRSNLMDGFRSWVSGHASLSFGGLTYLSIFLSSHVLKYLAESSPPNSMMRLSSSTSHRSQTQDSTNHPSAPLLLLLSAPVLLAIYIATTRFSDYRHHGIDIILGSLLGIGTAILGWCWYGSRSVHGTRGFGGLYNSRKGGCRCGDADLEMAENRDIPMRATTSEEFHHSNAENLRSFSTGNQPGDGVSQSNDEGNSGVGASRGALQLREINLSISTLDTPEAASQKRADTSQQYDGESSSNPSRSQVLDGEQGGVKPEVEREFRPII